MLSSSVNLRALRVSPENTDKSRVLWPGPPGPGPFPPAMQCLLFCGTTSGTGPVWRPPTSTPSPVSKRIFMRGGAARAHEELL